jgi:hypothetical protein
MLPNKTTRIIREKSHEVLRVLVVSIVFAGIGYDTIKFVFV